MVIFPCAGDIASSNILDLFGKFCPRFHAVFINSDIYLFLLLLLVVFVEEVEYKYTNPYSKGYYFYP